jgi:hypothetical protein
MDRPLIMNFLRKHWYDLGGLFSTAIFIYLFLNHNNLTNYQILMWLSLTSLFLHQLEEYRIVGTFPGMLNTVMYNSKMPDRYPLNSNSAFFINVFIGWLFYFLAAVVAEKAVWLGIATILVSIGNTIAHTILFNIKGKTLYNAGLITSCFLFVPCAYFFISIISTNHFATMQDCFLGVFLGITLNVVGVLKIIDWMADKDTIYIFDDRNLLPKNIKKK